MCPPATGSCRWEFNVNHEGHEGIRRKPIDPLVKDLVVVEVKSGDAVAPVHHAQVITYLKLSGKSVGLLINFNVVHLKDGIKRFVNGTDWK
jgi:GxxExxY protein